MGDSIKFLFVSTAASTKGTTVSCVTKKPFRTLRVQRTLDKSGRRLKMDEKNMKDKCFHTKKLK